MIISCSAKALSRIEEAKFNRIGKKERFPLIVKDKELIEKLRKAIEGDPHGDELIWNLDILSMNVRGDKNETIGVSTTGYLVNPSHRGAVILNGLDDVDFCHIGSVAKRGISTIADDCYVNPIATRHLFMLGQNLSRHLIEICKEHGMGWDTLRDLEYPEPTILIPNGDRSMTATLNHIKRAHEQMLFGNGGAYLSSEPVDRGSCYRINRMPISGKPSNPEDEDSPCPSLLMRRNMHETLGHRPCPAVKLRLQVIDWASYYESGGAESGMPLCYRDVIVPMEASLSWLHQVIQKTFYWADYHLHDFQFLSLDAKEILDAAFEVIFPMAKPDSQEEGEENVFAAPGGEQLFLERTKMSLRWLYADFTQGMIEEDDDDYDYPISHLPESQPIGLFLLGSSEYERFLDLFSAKEWETLTTFGGQGLYYEYDYGSTKELSIVPLEFLVEDGHDLPRITNAVGHTPPEDSSYHNYLALLEALDTGNSPDEDGIDILAWAENATGWRPFTGIEDLSGHFDRLTGM